MTETLFLKLYDSLSRRLFHDTRNVNLNQCLHLVPDALQSGHAPVILYEAIQNPSASLTAYYPLNEQAYRIALPKISITRFNICNTTNNRQRVFCCGLDWWDGVGYLYASLDMPRMPEEPQALYHELYDFMDALAKMLSLHLAPVKLGWYRPGARG